MFGVVRRWNTKLDDEMARRPTRALTLLAALSGFPQPAAGQRFWSVLREGDLWWLQRDGQTSLSLGMGGLSTQGECCCGNVPPSSPQHCSPAGCLASTCAVVPEAPPDVAQWELDTAQTVTSLGFNTAGSWSDTVWATKGLLPMSVPVLNIVVPYMAQANLSAYFPDWSNGHAILFPDVFSALFARTAREVAERGVTPLVNNTCGAHLTSCLSAHSSDGAVLCTGTSSASSPTRS